MIGKVVVPGGTALWYCTISFVLCWYGQTFRNIVTLFPSALLALLVSVAPSALPLPLFVGSARTLLPSALRLLSDLCSLQMSSD